MPVCNASPVQRVRVKTGDQRCVVVGICVVGGTESAPHNEAPCFAEVYSELPVVCGVGSPVAMSLTWGNWGRGSWYI